MKIDRDKPDPVEKWSLPACALVAFVIALQMFRADELIWWLAGAVFACAGVVILLCLVFGGKKTEFKGYGE